MSWTSEAAAAAPPTLIAEETTRLLWSAEPTLMKYVSVQNNLRLYGLNSGFFYFPLSVALHERENRDALRDLGITVALGHGHFAIMDQAMDANEMTSELLVLSQLMLDQYLERMETFYGRYFDVRRNHRQRYRQYALAACREQRHRGQLRDIALEDLESLGSKSAPACTPLRAVLLAAGRTQAYSDDVENAFLAYASALQLIDDLADIDQDFREGLSSIPLNMILRYSMKLPSWPTESRPDLYALSVASGARAACLKLTVELLELAAAQADATQTIPLQELVKERYERVSVQLASCPRC